MRLVSRPYLSSAFRLSSLAAATLLTAAGSARPAAAWARAPRPAAIVQQPAAQQPVAQPPGVPHAGMMRFPALSADRIAFVYGGKVWSAPRDGGMASPVATPDGNAAFPRFSPDGRTIAMTASYDGNPDLYTIAVDGGAPMRVTHSPGQDVLCGWTADGKLLFSGSQFSQTNGQPILMTVPATGGMPTPMPIPYGQDGAISPDGKYLAYTPTSINQRTWKRYRGGWAPDIWLMNLQDKSARRITEWEGNDTFPMWESSSALYYLSDSGPEHRLNLWRLDINSNKREQITKFTDYDVQWPSIGPGGIIFQHGPELRILDTKTRSSKAVTIRMPGDRANARPRTIDVSRFLTEFAISPSAKRVLAVGRGDIWSLPAKEGSPRLVSRTDGARERGVSWSPDGKTIAYFSDASGEYELYVQAADLKTPARALTRGSAIWYDMVGFSPDSKWIHYTDKSGNLLLCEVATGSVKIIDRDPGGRAGGGSFSSDSRFVTYARSGDDPRKNSAIWIYEVETGKKTQVTAGAFRDSSPTFDRKGEWLFYVSSRIFGSPTYDENGTSFIYNNTQTIVATPLRRDIVSPMNPKVDEEPAAKPAAPSVGEVTALADDTIGIQAAQPADEVSGTWKGTFGGTPAGDAEVTVTLQLSAGGVVSGSAMSPLGNAALTGKWNPATKALELTATVPDGPAIEFRGKIENGAMNLTGMLEGITVTLKATRQTPAPPANTPPANTPPVNTPKPPTPAAAKPMTIDYDGLEARGMALPIRPGNFGGLTMNAANQLLFVRVGTPGTEALAGLKAVDWTSAGAAERPIFPGAGGYDITPDGKKLLIFAGSGALIVDAVAGGAPEAVPTGGMQVVIDPRPEWKQILREAWRLERDYFYDPNMHGVDWNAVWTQYSAMLPDANSRADVGYIISEMISELNVGHAYYSPGLADAPATPGVAGPVGVLGCDFTLENGAYKISRILRGAPWDTDAIGPLSQPGVDVKEGDYLLAVNGVPVDNKKDPWAALVNQGGRIVTLTVSAKPTMDSTAREVAVRTLVSDDSLRYRAWIERNRQFVEKMSGGRVGYIYVPNTGADGQSDLVRQFVGQVGKDALIIDDRWNGGGQIPTRFIELLNRPMTNSWARRDAFDMVWPPDSNFGPKAMLINGQAGSGGDAFPYYFRQAGLGKLIGMRTWGGLVGISGGPALLDNARVTEPSFAFYKLDGTWGIEGHGVDPDIEVIDDPSKMQNGSDPQLTAAVTNLLDELRKKPPMLPKRPAYPNRSGMGVEKRDR